ncbi:hypothetical protein L596_004833 [Steinernema carpocapsae]|uniref:HECT-type E3 ubiquitin transferase n=1 Tax=Steinernema carpocapsae TaxID=34508 RepID=A0A4U8V0L8_STECR|nr:hypothetical protein L596_004833 [Steinernema carpocapsae]
MKLATNKPSGGGDLHPACDAMFQQVLKLDGSKLSAFLETAEWPTNAPKSEMQRWIPVLNKFDRIMECALREDASGRKIVDNKPDVKKLVEEVLRFSWILYENTFSRSVYSSIDRLIELLDVEDICLVTKTLAFLLAISKRSRFISQMQKDLKRELSHRLYAIVLSWDGQTSEVRMTQACNPDFSCQYFPIKVNGRAGPSQQTIVEPDYDKVSLQEMWKQFEEMEKANPIDDQQKHLIRAGIRMAYSMRDYELRMHVVIARLMSFSVLAYSRLCFEHPTVQLQVKNTLIGEIEEILLRPENFEVKIIDKLKCEALRTLTSLVNVDKQSRIRAVIDATGADTYHGYVSAVTRICVDDLKADLIGKSGHMSTQFATALFSLLYHIAGADAPVNHRLARRSYNLSASIMDSLLDVISSDTISVENIGFITRAIRVIDIITSSDGSGFNNIAGIQAAVNRFVIEVRACKDFYSSKPAVDPCNHQRAALMKSLLNFLKQSVSDAHFADACRPMMDGDLPECLNEILDNANFFGGSLFYNAVCLITSFVYQEPTKLTVLQDKGVCDAVMRGMFRYETPMSRDMIAHIPSTLSALCLNERGLETVKNGKYFEKIFNTIFSMKFMTISKKKKAGLVDSAQTLGTSLEELLRHQPSLRSDLYKALVNSIDRIKTMTEDPKNKLVYSAAAAIAMKNGDVESEESSVAPPTTVTVEALPRRQYAGRGRMPRGIRGGRHARTVAGTSNNNELSDDEDDDDATSNEAMTTTGTSNDTEATYSEGFSVGDAYVVPVGEYATYVCRVIETMVAQSTSSENARLFIELGVVQKLIRLLWIRRVCVEMYQNGLQTIIANIVRTLLLNGHNTTVLEDVLMELCEVTSTCSKYDPESEEDVLLGVQDETTGAFLIGLHKDASKVVIEDICSIGSVAQVLLLLIRRPMLAGQTNDIRALLLKHFVNSQYGKRSMENIAKWFRFLTWEMCAWQSKMKISNDEKLDGKKSKKAATKDPNIPTVPLASESESVIVTSDQIGMFGHLAKIQKTVADIQCSIVNAITDFNQKRFVEKMTNDCPKAFVLIDEIFRTVMLNLQWEGAKPVEMTRNLFCSAVIDFLRSLFATTQTMSYCAAITRFFMSQHYETFCNAIGNLANELGSPGIGFVVDAWISVVSDVINCRHGKRGKLKIGKQHEFMFGCKKVDIKAFLSDFRMRTYDNIIAIYASLSDRNELVDLPEHQVNILCKCLQVFTDINASFNKAEIEEIQKRHDDISLLAVTDDSEALTAMGFKDKQAKVALSFLGSNETSANFLSQYTSESKTPRLPSAEEIRRSKKAKKQETEEAARKEELDEVQTPVDDPDVGLYVKNEVPFDLVLRLYRTFFKEHDFVLAEAARYASTMIQQQPLSVQRHIYHRDFISPLVHSMSAFMETYPQKLPIESEFCEDSMGILIREMRFLCLTYHQLPVPALTDLIEPSVVEILFKFFVHVQAERKMPGFARAIEYMSLILELVDKTAIFENRRAMYCESVVCAKWKYWNSVSESFGGESSKKSGWVQFPSWFSSELDSRYKLGYETWDDAEVDGERRCSINFSDMVCSYGETGPVIPITVDVTLKKSVDSQTFLNQDDQSILTINQRLHLLKSCVELLTFEEADADCVHSLLAQITRLLRDYSMVPYFMELKGLETILKLESYKSMGTTPFFVTVILNHCLDNDVLLEETFEKLIRTYLRGGNISAYGGTEGYFNRWPRLRSGRFKEWIHVIHSLSSAGARNSRVLSMVLNKITSKTNDQMEALEKVKVSFPCMEIPPPMFDDLPERVVGILLNYILEHRCTEDDQMLITRSFLLRTLAELTKNYGCVATCIVDIHEHSDVFSTMIELSISSEERHVGDAARAFLMTVASATHSPEVQKALIEAVRQYLNTTVSGNDLPKIVSNIQEIANLLLHFRDACPPNVDVPAEVIERQGNHNAVFWHIVDSGILNDLVNCVWKVKNCEKDDIVKMATAIVKTLEELTRFSGFLKKRDEEEGSNATEVRSETDETEEVHPVDQAPMQAVVDEMTDRYAMDELPVQYETHHETGGDDDHEEDIDEDEEEEDEEEDTEPMDETHARWYEEEEDGEGVMNDLDDEMDTGDDDMSRVDDHILEEVLEDIERAERNDPEFERYGSNVFVLDHAISGDGGFRSTAARNAFGSGPGGPSFGGGGFGSSRYGGLNEWGANGRDSGDVRVLYSRGAGLSSDFLPTLGVDNELGVSSHPLLRHTSQRLGTDGARFVRLGLGSRAISPDWFLNRSVFEPPHVLRTRRLGPNGHVLQRQNAVRRYPHTSMLTAAMYDDSIYRELRRYGDTDLRPKASGRHAVPTSMDRYIESSRLMDNQSITYIFSMICAAYCVPQPTEGKPAKEEGVRYWGLSGEDRNEVETIDLADDDEEEEDSQATNESDAPLQFPPIPNLAPLPLLPLPLPLPPFQPPSLFSNIGNHMANVGHGIPPLLPPSALPGPLAAFLETIMQFHQPPQQEFANITLPTHAESEVSGTFPLPLFLAPPASENRQLQNDDSDIQVLEELSAMSSEDTEEDDDVQVIGVYPSSSNYQMRGNEAPPSTPSAATDPHQANGSQRNEVGPSNELDENLRQILGDLEVPDGVDPAFLAALPEDMRSEVIRDHLRQQGRSSSTSGSQSATPSVPPEPSSENPVGDDASAEAEEEPIIPPLDQEFLAALPPELQEELIQQHERDVRLAREAQNASSAPQAEEPVDPAALLESLPPSLRAQVLADADDSVIQVLPPTMADEARRLRANLEQQQALRYARLPRNLGMGSNGGALSRHREIMRTNESSSPTMNTVQFLNPEALTTVILFLFLDDAKVQPHSPFAMNKLMKLIRNLCNHGPSCDYIILGLTQFMETLSSSAQNFGNIKARGDPNTATWLERLTYNCGMGRHEPLVVFPGGTAVGRRIGPKILRSRRVPGLAEVLPTAVGQPIAAIHPRAIPRCATAVSEALQNIARAFPTQFLPQSMYPVKVDTAGFKKPNFNIFFTAQCILSKWENNKEDLTQFQYPSFSKAPIASVLSVLTGEWLQKTEDVYERLLRICNVVIHKIPDDIMFDGDSDALKNSLRCIVKIITLQGRTETHNDGRLLLAECTRAFGESSKEWIFELLIESIESLGLHFLPELISLEDELSKCCLGNDNDKSGESKELIQSTTIKLSSMKLSGQDQLLDSVQSLIAIRGLIQSIEIKREKNRKAAEAKKAEKQAAQEAIPAQEAISNANPATADNVADPTVDPTVNPTVDPTVSNAEVSTEDKVREASKSVEEEKPPTVEDYEDLKNLEPLWDVLSSCLAKLEAFSGQRAVVTLQPATEAFFLVHTPSSLPDDLTDYMKKHSLLDSNLNRLHEFAEKHRRVLNQILRVSGSQLMEEGGSFRILMLFPKLLDFDVKRKFFRKEIHRRERDDRSFIRRDDVGIRIRRSHLFSDSFRELFRLRSNDWKSRFYVVFEGEEGQDAGGLLREWFSVITREIFNPNYALFSAAPGDRATYMINKASYINPEHLDYFKFVGKIIAKAIYENKLLDCYFTRAFYKHILNLPVRYQDIESEDPSYYKSLEYLLTNPVEHVAELTFSVDVDEFGVVSRRELKENGLQLPVTDDNKEEYVQLVCQMKMTGSIRKQLDAFLEGFYEIIPKQLISIFNEQELELLISGLPTIDIDDLCANTEYKTYTKSSPQIQWFWRALRSFEREDLAKFLQFVTGTSKVPLQGFSTLEGMNGVQKFSIHCDYRSNDRLPAAHTCFNQLDLPQYENYEKLRSMLLMAIRECTEGFGFA